MKRTPLRSDCLRNIEKFDAQPRAARYRRGQPDRISLSPIGSGQDVRHPRTKQLNASGCVFIIRPAKAVPGLALQGIAHSDLQHSVMAKRISFITWANIANCAINRLMMRCQPRSSRNSTANYLTWRCDRLGLSDMSRVQRRRHRGFAGPGRSKHRTRFNLQMTRLSRTKSTTR
jgi:hypothetical protein